MQTRMRPRFARAVPVEPEALRRAIVAALPTDAVGGQSVPGHVDLWIARDRHTWSPWLSLELRRDTNGHTDLRGLYGPSPHVWTMFMAGYAVAAFAVVMGVMVAWAQGIADEARWGGWITVAGLGVGAGLWAGAQVGQRLGHDQMGRLAAFLDARVQEALGVEG